MSATDHINWNVGHIVLVDGSTVKWTSRVNQDVKDCKISGVTSEVRFPITGLEEVEAGSFEAAVRAKLQALSLVSKNVGQIDGILAEIAADFVPNPLSAKHVLAGLVPAPVTIFERTDEEMVRDTKPFDFTKPIKRIDKIAKY